MEKEIVFASTAEAKQYFYSENSYGNFEKIHIALLEDIERYSPFGGKLKKKLTPTDIMFLSGYFVFDLPTNTIMRFRLKETPKWLFGVWLSENIINDRKVIKVTMFAQNEMWIDKFKPSYSEYVAETNIYYKTIFDETTGAIIKHTDEIEALEEDEFTSIINKFHMIFVNKYYSFYHHMTGDIGIYPVSQLKAIIYYYQFIRNEKIKKIRQNQLDRIQIKGFKKLCKKIIEGSTCEIIDRNDKDSPFTTHPRYSTSVNLTAKQFYVYECVDRLLDSFYEFTEKTSRKRKFSRHGLFSEVSNNIDFKVNGEYLNFFYKRDEKLSKEEIDALTEEEALKLIKEDLEELRNRNKKNKEESDIENESIDEEGESNGSKE